MAIPCKLAEAAGTKALPPARRKLPELVLLGLVVASAPGCYPFLNFDISPAHPSSLYKVSTVGDLPGGAPAVVAIAPNGDFLITDPTWDLVEVSPSGGESTVLRRPGGLPIRGMYCDSGGNLYYAVGAQIFEMPEDDSTASVFAKLQVPVISGLAGYDQGALYAASGSRILKVGRDGTVTVLVGKSGLGMADGAAPSAKIESASSLTMDASGDLFFVDGLWRVRELSSGGVVSTLAGQSGEKEDYRDGPGSQALFGDIRGLAADRQGDVYVADYGNNLIREISTSDVVSTLAGTGRAAESDGIGLNEAFDLPSRIAVNGLGDIYVFDSYGPIREISPLD